MTNNEPVIKVRKLKIAFGSKVVLDEIDLDLYPGDVVEPRKNWINENVVFTLEDSYKI